MTIPSTASEVSYAGDGITTVLPIPFVFDTSVDILVRQQTAGVISTITTGFTISGGGGGNGQVTFTLAPPTGTSTWVFDNPAVTQPTDYIDNDSFPAESHERALDRVTRLVKRLTQQMGRKLGFADGDTQTNGELADIETRKGKYLFFDAVTGAITYALSITGTTLTQIIYNAFLADSDPYKRTAAEIAAGVTPSNYGYPPGHLIRYGATLNGVTDDTAALQRWMNVAGDLFFPSGTALITATITASSNTSIRGVLGSIIKTATTNISIISAATKSNISIQGVKLLQTSAGANANIGGIFLDSCTFCTVRDCEFDGMQWAGVWLNNSSFNSVDGNYFHGFLGTVQDSADVNVYRNSQSNTISNNKCNGGGWHGILIQDPGSSTLPLRNSVIGNRVGAHSTYGIAAYNINAANNYTEIIGNHIEGITGVNPTGNGGAGIYVQNSGGVVVSNNTVYNCCISSSGATLTPAGIGLNNIDLASGLVPTLITGNMIRDIGIGNNNAIAIAGISVSSSSSGAVVSGNTITFSTSVGSAASVGVFINASSRCVVSSNTVSMPTTGATQVGIFCFANGIAMTDISITGNVLLGMGFAGIRFDTNAAFTHTGITVNGNRHSNGGTSCISYRLSLMINSVFGGNSGNSSTVAALTINACTQLRCANNALISTGANTVVSSGACTGSYFDKSNYSAGSGGAGIESIQNAATNMIVEQLGNAAPGANNRAVGDRVEQSVPVVGQPKGWRTTVSGTPGTTVSEGNL